MGWVNRLGQVDVHNVAPVNMTIIISVVLAVVAGVVAVWFFGDKLSRLGYIFCIVTAGVLIVPAAYVDWSEFFRPHTSGHTLFWAGVSLALIGAVFTPVIVRYGSGLFDVFAPALACSGAVVLYCGVFVSFPN